MSAISLYNRPSATFDAKVSASIALLQRVAAEHQPLTQASSLGVEDMVVTHLIHLAGISSGIFVLDTGKLHAETLGLIGKKGNAGQLVRLTPKIPEPASGFDRQRNVAGAKFRQDGAFKQPGIAGIGQDRPAIPGCCGSKVVLGLGHTRRQIGAGVDIVRQERSAEGPGKRKAGQQAVGN